MNTLLLEIQQLMHTLRLDGEEKNAWSNLLPIMNEEELRALKANLEQQFSQMTDIYLTALQNKSA